MLRSTIRILLLIFSIILLSAVSRDVHATHIAGANLEYTCLGGNTYSITINALRDCTGGPPMPTTIQLTFESQCSTYTQSINRISLVEKSQLCPNQISNSSCNQGFLPGFQHGVFTGTFVIPPCPLGPTVISGAVGPRNMQSMGNVSGGGLAIEAELDNYEAPCNNSPKFDSRFPNPYVCVNQEVKYNWGVTETDGDSLVFDFGIPYNYGLNPSNYNPGYSHTNPFPVPVQINSSTGEVTFTPNLSMLNPEFWVLKVCVEEYRNGVYIGKMCRDMQFVVQQCSNYQPYMVNPGIQNFTGTGLQTDSLSVTTCPGENFDFDIEFADSLTPGQTQQNLTLTTNAQSVVPWVNVSITGNNPVIVNFSGTVPQQSNPFYVFTIDVADDACPVMGVTSEQFNLTVLPDAYVPDYTICGYNDTFYIDAVGGDSFTYQVLSGDTMIPGTTVKDTTGEDGKSMWFAPRYTTTYEVTSLTPGPCSNIDTFTVSVNQLVINSDTTLCRGDTLNFNVSGTSPCSGGNELYSWSPATGLDNPHSANPTLTVGENQSSTTYTLQYNDGCGCLTSADFFVDVSEISVDTVIWDKPVCGDSNATLEIQASGGFGGYSLYSYSLDTLSGFVSDSFFTDLSIGYFETFAKDSLGCVSPVYFDTIIDPGVPEIVEDSTLVQDVTCFEAENGIIDIYASGGAPPLNYSIDSGVTYQTNPEFTNLDSGDYQIVITDSFDCRTLPFKVRISSNTELIIDSITAPHLDCYGDQDGQIHIHNRGGTHPLEFSIDNGNSWSNDSIHTNLSAGIYVIFFRDSLGCITDPVPLELLQPDELTAQLNIKHDSCYQDCGGRAIANVAGGTTPYTYNWNGYGSDNDTSWNLCSGPNYLFDVTDANGCIIEIPFFINQPDELKLESVHVQDITCRNYNDGSINISPSGGTTPYTYSIDEGNNFSSDSKFKNLEEGEYIIVVKDSASRCQTQDTAFIQNPDSVEVSVTFNEKKICVSNCVDLSAQARGGTGSNYKYLWSDPAMDYNGVQNACPQTDTVYVVYAEDENECTSDVELIEISFYDSLNVYTENELEICPGDTTFLTAIGEGGKDSAYTYTWSPLVGLGSSGGQSIEAFPSETVSYTVTLTDDCGSPAVTDSVTVKVHHVNEPGFSVEDTRSGCAPFSVVLNNETQDIQFARWEVGADFIFNGFSVDIMDLNEGSYDVTLTVNTPDGCTASITKNNYLNVYKNPAADFTFEPDAPHEYNTQMQFTDRSSSDVTERIWTFDTDVQSFEKNPVHRFDPEKDSALIKLKVYNQYRCKDSITKELYIEPAFNMFVPNAFTPNADGINDTFAPVFTGINPDKYSLTIFNRWGNIVFESNRIHKPWDGRIQNNNTPAPAGIYVWKITVKDNSSDRNTHEQTGSLVLIR